MRHLYIVHDLYFLLMIRKFTHLILLLLAIPVAIAQTVQEAFVVAAIERTKHDISYDGSYFSIPYPGGDVPKNVGVCTDVVIRAYREVGIDLQLLVHEDMQRNFAAYPSRRIWGMQRPDTNIDHRRMPNLRAFFKRKGKVLPVTENKGDYLAGEVVTWVLPGNLPHIGIVSNLVDPDSQIPLIVHNIGRGPELENMLFAYNITGHYRYFTK